MHSYLHGLVRLRRLEQRYCVCALFSQGHKKSSYEIRNCLIFFVDQPGLEPGTSRLWVCCSNQLSYKSGVSFCRMRGKSNAFAWNMQAFSVFSLVFLMVEVLKKEGQDGCPSRASVPCEPCKCFSWAVQVSLTSCTGVSLTSLFVTAMCYFTAVKCLITVVVILFLRNYPSCLHQCSLCADT